jgi:thiol:disulfide interchange protein DsbD
MGAAAAWSVTQPRLTTLATFAAIGAGMALPYLALSAFPSLLSRVPRAGPASELIKQTMALLMLAAASYFFGTGLAAMLAKAPDPPTQAYWWVVAFFIAAAGIWLSGRTLRIAVRPLARLSAVTLGGVIAVAGILSGVRLTRGSPIHWTYFTAERFSAARSQPKVVVLEFTAGWCLNCTALEQAVLHNPKVVKLLNSDKVIPIKVDITGNNPAGDQKLVEVGRRTIPYLVVYSPQGNEVFTSDAYTVDQLSDEITKVLP